MFALLTRKKNQNNVKVFIKVYNGTKFCKLKRLVITYKTLFNVNFYSMKRCLDALCLWPNPYVKQKLFLMVIKHYLVWYCIAAKHNFLLLPWQSCSKIWRVQIQKNVVKICNANKWTQNVYLCPYVKNST